MKKRRTLKLLAVNLTILMTLLVFVELIFGAWIFKDKQLAFFGVSPNMNEQFEITFYTETPVTVRHTRDQYGLRGQNSFNQPEKIDILTIGGSTTFQKFIDDADTWESHLEDKLKAAGKSLIISNAGINGHSTHAHIKAFDLWLSNIEHLKPRYILFYIGINDFLPRPFLLSGNTENSPIKAALQGNSIIYNALRRAKGAYMAKKNEFESNVDFSQHEFNSTTLLTAEYREFYLNEFIPAFKQRQQKLIDLSLAMGAEPVFITQPMALYRFEEGKLSGVAAPLYDYVTRQALTGVDCYELISHVNKAMHEVCGQKFKIIELTSLQIWKTEDFHDWFHNTPKGTQKVADEIWKQLGFYLH
ncbi:MAG: SGNH/GDSL hydrolase family protein [Roseivirga sp.]|nr:SGNH/GDSL hydrolase family protein [Roseivirga sp.]